MTHELPHLRAAVIGLGTGARHAEAYASLPGVEVAALCDTNEARLNEVGASFPGAWRTTHWRDIVAAPDIHVVSVCTPDRLHFRHASELVRAGKHVLCEKPMTTSLADARELVYLVYQYGVCFAVGNVLRYVPQFAWALDTARSHKLGDLFMVEADYAHDMRETFQRTPWRIDPARPQNAIFGGGVHPIDLLRRAAGEAVEVFAYGNHKTLPEYHSEDSVLISLKFASGCVGKVWVTFGVRQRPHNRINLNLYGSQGSLQANSQEAAVRAYWEGMAPGQTDWATVPLALVQGHPVREELQDLVDAIRWGRATRVDVVDGARTVAIMEAAQKSLERGTPMPVEEVPTPRSLRMLRPNLQDLPSDEPPEGYELRTFEPGDEAHWLRICKPEFGMSWGEAELHREILDAPWFQPEDMFFVTCQGVPVGVAAAWRCDNNETTVGTLHYIAVQPEHRGHGLGRVLVAAVLQRLRQLDFQACDLSTNDTRWSALGLYWRYGYRPQIETELDRLRWETIRGRLGVVE